MRSTIGSVTGDGRLRVKDHGKVVAEIPNRELADEAPLYDRPHTKPLSYASRWKRPAFRSRRLERAICETLLASGDLCSKRWIWRAVRLQRPHEHDRWARAATPRSCASRRPARRSRCRSTATAGTATSTRAKARSWSSPSAAAIFPPSARCRSPTTNNLNFGNPERPEIMAQLVEAIEGMAEACAFFDDADHRRQRQPV